MTVTRMLVLGAVRIFQPTHGYFVRRELGTWQAAEWAHLNGLATFDMSVGDFEYKLRWADYSYDAMDVFAASNRPLFVAVTRTRDLYGRLRAARATVRQWRRRHG